MAGQIIISNIKTDSDNAFSILANTGAVLFSANLASGITTGIADGSVTNAKLAGSISNDKLAGSITGNKIATGQITGNLIATNAISQNNIVSVNASVATVGTLPTARLPSGTVLQVLSVTDTTQTVFNSGSGGQTIFYDISGLSLTITPRSSTSKILIMADIAVGQASNSYNAHFRMSRGITPIGVGANGSYIGSSTTGFRSSDGSELGSASINYLDSPETTSATIYKVQICNTGGSGYPSYYNRPANASTGWELTGSSTLTIMEIAA
jgi:hypothetical protein